MRSFVLLISIIGFVASSFVAYAQEDRVEILIDTCVFEIPGGQRVPISDIQNAVAMGPASIECQVLNTSGSVVVVKPKLTLHTEKPIEVETEDTYVLLAEQEPQTVVFSLNGFNQETMTGIQYIDVALTTADPRNTEESKYTASTKDLTQESEDTLADATSPTNPPPSPTPITNFLLPVLMMFLSLIILITIWMYLKRKQATLAQTPPSTDGEGEA